MKLGIMQPYFFPYIGYFQLISSVDVFVVYDNIKYTKKGWINRNRLLQNGKDKVFSLHLKCDSDALNICERELAQDFNRSRLLNQINGAYRRAPYFEQIVPLIEQIVFFQDINLFRFLHNSITAICRHLGVDTAFRTSSEIEIDHNLKSQDKVIALCSQLKATQYINPIGGKEIYSKEEFSLKGIDMKFIKSEKIEYHQFVNEFVPWLSIIDVLMFNAPEIVHQMLKRYELE